MLGRLLDDSYAAAVRHNLTTITAARLVTNALLRYAPPFLAVIARGLDVSIAELGLALTAAELSGFAAPLVGRLVDRISRRVAMVVGLVGVGAGALIVAASGHIIGFAAGLLVLTLFKMVYDVGQGSWIADHVPFARRSRVVGLNESSWALGLLLGVSSMGLLTTFTSWVWAYVAGAAVVAAMAVVVWARVPDDDARELAGRPNPVTGVGAPAGAAKPPAGTARRWGEGAPSPREEAGVGAPAGAAKPPAARHRPGRRGRQQHLKLAAPGWYAVASVFCLGAASQSVFVTFGPWLVDAHGFTTVLLTTVTFSLGALELGATALVATRTDRWGKERSVIGGGVLMIVGLGGLALAHGSLPAGLLLLGLTIAGFEFAIVSAIPIGADLYPGQPGKGLSRFLMAVTMGRASAIAPATALFERHGLTPTAAIAAVFSLGLVVAMSARLRVLRTNVPAAG